MGEKIIKPLFLQVIGALVAGCTILGYAPIGIGYFAAMFSLGTLQSLTLPVAVAAMYFTIGPFLTLKNTIIMVSIAILIKIFEIAKLKMNMLSTAVLCSVTSIVLETAGVCMGSGERTDLIVAAFMGMAAGAFAAVFYKGMQAFLRPGGLVALDNEEMVSMCIVFSIITYHLINADMVPQMIVNIIVLFVVVSGGFKYGAGMGALLGSICGLVVGVPASKPEYVGIIALMGVCSGSFRELGRIGSALGFATGVFATGMLMSPDMLEISYLKCMAIAIFAFLLVPHKLMIRKTNIVKPDNVVYKQELRNWQGMIGLSQAVDLISENMLEEEDDDYDSFTKESFASQISGHICNRCINYNVCWGVRCMETYKETGQLLESVRESGTATLSNLPSTLRSKCVNTGNLIAEVNHMFEMARVNYIWKNRMWEYKKALVQVLKETSGMMRETVNESQKAVRLEEARREYIKQMFESFNTDLESMSISENKNERYEVLISIRPERKMGIRLVDVERIINEGLGRKFKVENYENEIVTKGTATLKLYEETNFTVVTGVAKIKKNNEVVSGDNFTFTEIGGGRIFMSIADGMGSGKKAFEDSDKVISLLEHLLENGFSEERALQMVNLYMMLKNDREAPTTLDMGVMDLYSGICDFLKLGSACTFIKRGDWVECIRSCSLPIGMFGNVETEIITKKLYDKDMVILVSDGVVDAMKTQDKEEKLVSLIMDTDAKNPKEAATLLMEKISKQPDFKATDDMTILVAGVWDKG